VPARWADAAGGVSRLASGALPLCLGWLCLAGLGMAPRRLEAQALELRGNLRIRTEAWDWFTPSVPADESYAFVGTILRGGIGAQRPRYAWRVDLAVPILLGLPDNAVAPPPQGQLGLGATYRAENGKQEVGLLVKQAFVRLRLGRQAGAATLRLGRFEFNDAEETEPRNPALSLLKRSRIAQRLIGSFAFTHVGRSFDGIELARSSPGANFTLIAVKPTEGVFQLDGLAELDAGLVYVALTKALFDAGAEGRLFALYYRDGRGVLKTDNRPAAVRALDSQNIGVATLGAHYLHTFPMGPGMGDVLLWGAWQTGDWGEQRHGAVAVAAELGYRPREIPLNPWLRAGYFHGRGDDSPGDDSHQTFFQVMPTPRPFARVPFYNLMNVRDVFAQILLRPSARWTLQADAHALRLAEPNDLWYSGGGAFDDESFGFVGRPGGGARSLAGLFDVSVDYHPSPRFGATLYLGRVRGDDVVRAVYPQGSGATFAYLELRRQF